MEPHHMSLERITIQLRQKSQDMRRKAQSESKIFLEAVAVKLQNQFTVSIYKQRGLYHFSCGTMNSISKMATRTDHRLFCIQDEEIGRAFQQYRPFLRKQARQLCNENLRQGRRRGEHPTALMHAVFSNGPLARNLYVKASSSASLRRIEPGWPRPTGQQILVQAHKIPA